MEHKNSIWPAPTPRWWRPHLRLTRPILAGRRTTLISLGAFCLAVGTVAGWASHHALCINSSESLPNWAFLVDTDRRSPLRGDYVSFSPGHDPLVVSHFGARPPLFLKIALGVAGDVVTHDGARVLINGREVARMKPFSLRGEALVPGPVGKIPRGCIYAGSAFKDGFDSRYAEIGLVCRDRLAGVGEPIL